jgi:hypothetical protein
MLHRRRFGDGVGGGCAFLAGGQQGSVTGRQVIDLSQIPEIASPGVTATTASMRTATEPTR